MDIDVEAGNWLDHGDAWLRALTRKRRAERACRRETLRISGESVEFDAASCAYVIQAETGRQKSRYKRWRVRQWQFGNRTCHYCRVGLTMKPPKDGQRSPTNLATVDHRTPLALNGEDSPVNWVMACHQCNNRKGMMTEAEYRAVMEPRRGIEPRSSSYESAALPLS